MIAPLPSNRIGSLAARTALFREHNATAVRAQPVNCFVDESGVGHGEFSSSLTIVVRKRECQPSFRHWQILQLGSFETMELSSKLANHRISKLRNYEISSDMLMSFIFGSFLW